MPSSPRGPRGPGAVTFAWRLLLRSAIVIVPSLMSLPVSFAPAANAPPVVATKRASTLTAMLALGRLNLITDPPPDLESLAVASSGPGRPAPDDSPPGPFRLVLATVSRHLPSVAPLSRPDRAFRWRCDRWSVQ